VLCEQSSGDEVHICDGVFEAEGDEGGDWEYDCEDFVSDGASGETEPDGEAYEGVAKDAAREGLSEREIYFGVGDVDGFCADGGVCGGPLTGEVY